METPFCPINFDTQREIEGNLKKKKTNQKDGQDFEVRSSTGDLSHSQPERKRRRKGKKGEKKKKRNRRRKRLTC